MTNTYSVRKLSGEELPQYINAAEFKQGVWAALLDDEVVAVCFEKEMADAIASNDLAIKTGSMTNGPWFPLNKNGEKIGYCLGSVLPRANRHFNH
ncbi:hypothetical protein [Pseudomonas lactis]|uniref:hypothetical protein n=1 Tax=Pseudomonas lactis TaxID=1615674 RepID=UPI00110C824B|nr:hypothetical protein [Pseudomonas lactis]MBK3446035.1 hypothetical protein [Pseudomonas lactis]